MKIYTRKGDSGTTQLIGGRRIPKYDVKIESYGTADELNSYIGLIRDQNIDKIHIEELLEIQDRLFTMGSHLANDSDSKMKLPELSQEDVDFLEKAIDMMDEVLEPMKSFVLPGGHTIVSYCHIARCVCRRAERSVSYLASQEELNPLIGTYLNRLSDYLFTLSRKLSADLQAIEAPWKPKM